MDAQRFPQISVSDAATQTEDRRRRPRVTTRTIGWLFPSDDAHEHAESIVITDISKLGVGFLFPTALANGTICKVRVGLGPERLARRLRIVSCRDTRDGTFHLGGEFVDS